MLVVIEVLCFGPDARRGIAGERKTQRAWRSLGTRRLRGWRRAVGRHPEEHCNERKARSDPSFMPFRSRSRCNNCLQGAGFVPKLVEHEVQNAANLPRLKIPRKRP